MIRTRRWAGSSEDKSRVRDPRAKTGSLLINPERMYTITKVKITGLTVLSVVLLFAACKKGPPDGNYCAKVQYQNKGTGKMSTYTIITEIKDNKLVDISFPEEHADKSSVKPVVIPKDGKFTAVTEAGEVYKIQMQGPAEKCIKSTNMIQCKGMSKDGKRCKRYTASKNGLCWQHDRK